MKGNLRLWGWGKLASDSIVSSPVELNCPEDVLGLALAPNVALCWTPTSGFKWGDSLLQSPEPLPLPAPTGMAHLANTILLSCSTKELVVLDGESVTSLEFPEELQSLATGKGHALALSYSGHVYSWGTGARGQLGQGSAQNSPRRVHLNEGITVLAIACGYSHSLALDRAGRVHSWGSGADGRLGLGDLTDRKTPCLVTQLTAVQVACGYLHSAVLTVEGELKSFGFNGYGQLGLGHCDVAKSPELCHKLSCVKLVGLACGAFHSAVLSDGGCVFTIGLGTKGQLGSGGFSSSSSPCLVSLKVAVPETVRGLSCGAECTVLLCGAMSEHVAFSEGVAPSQPVKSPEQHQQMAHQARLYLEQVRAREKSQKRQRARQLAREGSLKEATATWESEILPHWETKRPSKQFETLIHKGVPAKLRGEVWFLLSGNPLSITQEYFDLSIQKAKLLRERIAAGDADTVGREASLQLVQQDIVRTFNQLGCFRDGSPLQQQLRQLLEAFIVARPDIGYIQGMSYIGGTVALHLDSFRAFVLFVNVVASPVLFPFYRVDQGGMTSRFQVFRVLFAHNLPALCDHFEMEGVHPHMFLFEWFATMFSRTLTQEVVGRVWDLYFYAGPAVLFRTGLAILRLLSGVLLAEGLAGIMMALSRTSEYIVDSEELVQQISHVKVPAWVIAEIGRFGHEMCK